MQASYTATVVQGGKGHAIVDEYRNGCQFSLTPPIAKKKESKIPKRTLLIGGICLLESYMCGLFLVIMIFSFYRVCPIYIILDTQQRWFYM
jgi:hypothetical protein